MKNCRKPSWTGPTTNGNVPSQIQKPERADEPRTAGARMGTCWGTAHPTEASPLPAAKPKIQRVESPAAAAACVGAGADMLLGPSSPVGVQLEGGVGQEKPELRSAGNQPHFRQRRSLGGKRQ